MVFDVLVVGQGDSGSALAMCARDLGVKVGVLDKLAGEMALDVVRSTDGTRVAGLTVLCGGAVQALRAKAIVLATGDAGVLFHANRPHATGDALALAFRLKLPVNASTVRVVDPPTLAAGLATDASGATPLAGLYAVGTATEPVREAPDVAAAAAAYARAHDAADLVDVPLYPDIDSPMPAGFAELKFERLRDTMRALLSPKPVDLDRVRIAVDRLKGEADDYARARLEPRLKEFQNTTHAARVVVGAFDRR